jgi:hypothetical protein
LKRGHRGPPAGEERDLDDGTDDASILAVRERL